MNSNYDVVVIGGGAAGLSGAVALARSRRSVLLIDAGEPRNAPAGHVHNYLGREGTPPASLLAIGREEARGYGAEIVTGTVTSAVARPGGFAVTLADGRTTRARRLLVATGLVDELPDVPGVAERWGRDVLHCPYCHGWEARDRAIGVLATNPMAVHQALLWRQLSDDVAVFRHTAPAFDAEQRDQLTARGIRVVEGKVTAVRVEDDAVAGVELASGEVVAREVVVVAPRFAARAGILRQLGVEVEETEFGSFAVADPTGATTAAGVWVAGNVAEMRAQVMASAAGGLTAGAMINADLVAEEVQRAREPFSHEAEREVAELIGGPRRHGI